MPRMVCVRDGVEFRVIKNEIVLAQPNALWYGDLWIDEDYGTGVMVAWDLPESPLPPGYRVYDGRWACVSGILRDGFDKDRELQMLKVVR